MVMIVVVGVSGCGRVTKSHVDKVHAVAAGARTQVVYVRPTTNGGSLKPGYAVSKRLTSGQCMGPSVFVTGVAYDCGVGTSGYRQCWPIGVSKSGQTFGEVFCLRNPWEDSGVEIRLQERMTAKPPPGGPSEERLVWGVQLAGGQRCVRLEHMPGVFRGATIDFACTGTNLYLLAAPDDAQAAWTIGEAVDHPEKQGPASLSAGPLGRIATAWYGEGAST
jgi:hypothetical protein